MNTDLPDPQTLRKLLRYEPETGKLFWRERTHDMFPTRRACMSWNTRFSKSEAFVGVGGHGYKQGGILGKMYRAHRVAWAVYHGSWPKAEIDHINGDPRDNRIVNLRDVTRPINMKNTSIYATNTSGHVGVYKSKSLGKWYAQIRINGKLKMLGYFDDINDAIAARKAAERGHGFTERHGSSWTN